jgi:hypothetical protein
MGSHLWPPTVSYQTQEMHPTYASVSSCVKSSPMSSSLSLQGPVNVPFSGGRVFRDEVMAGVL